MAGIVYTAVGYSTDRYDRAGEESVRFADVGRIWAWVDLFLATPGRKVVVHRVEGGYRSWSGVWRRRRARKIWTGRSGDAIPTRSA